MQAAFRVREGIGLARVGVMSDTFAAHFCRNDDGSWTCVSPGTLKTVRGRIDVTPGSRFYPGTTFGGLDVAGWLEQHVDGNAERCG
jgi:hypothetical protein